MVRSRRLLNTVLLLSVVAVIRVERGARVLGSLRLAAVRRRRVVVPLGLAVALVVVGLVPLVVVVHLVLLVGVVLAGGGHPARSVHGLGAATTSATGGAAMFSG